MYRRVEPTSVLIRRRKKRALHKLVSLTWSSELLLLRLLLTQTLQELGDTGRSDDLVGKNPRGLLLLLLWLWLLQQKKLLEKALMLTRVIVVVIRVAPWGACSSVNDPSLAVHDRQ